MSEVDDWLSLLATKPLWGTGSEADERWEAIAMVLLRRVSPPNLRIRQTVNLSGLRLKALPDGLRVDGDLILHQTPRLQNFGREIEVTGTLELGGKARCIRQRVKSFHPELHRLAQDSQCYLKSLPPVRAHTLRLARCPFLKTIEPGSQVKVLELRACNALERLPDGLKLDELRIVGCRNLRKLGAEFKVGKLELINCGVQSLPDDLECKELYAFNCQRLRKLPRSVRGKIKLERLPSLKQLPDEMVVPGLGVLSLNRLDRLEVIENRMEATEIVIHRCKNLKRFVPARLRLAALRIERCPQLEELPSVMEVDSLSLRYCLALSRLPDTLRLRARLGGFVALDVTGCENLLVFPKDFQTKGVVALEESGLEKAMPPHLNFEVQCRGLALPAKAYFHPESIDVEEALRESNVELRRVLLERVGMAEALSHPGITVLDQDEDPGGARSLLRIGSKKAWYQFRAKDSYVFLRCSCPSTGRNYLLRVPPTTTSCRQAAAWLAGFDNPDDYQPLQET